VKINFAKSLLKENRIGLKNMLSEIYQCKM